MSAKDQITAIAPFKRDQNIILHPFPNGGWVVTLEGPMSGDQDAKLGAYSTADDMLKALGEALRKGGDA